MNRNYQEFYWHKLDNAAKIYSCVSTDAITNVFRFSAMLTEPVQKDVLQRALETALDELPAFKVKMRRGLFWYYFETNFAAPIVREERTFPCSRIDKSTNNCYLFRMTYIGCHIHFEVFHALTDGNGAVIFFKTVLYHYLRELYPEQIPSGLHVYQDLTSLRALEENSFAKYVRKTPDMIRKAEKAFHIDGVKMFRGEMRVIHAACSAREVIRLAKEMGVTLTVYLAGLMAYSIYTQAQRHSRSRGPIIINVPINLRNLYDSDTVRNFFACINLRFDPDKFPLSPGDDLFAFFVQETARQMKEGQSQEALSTQFSQNVKAEQNIFLRIVPLFLKNPVLQYMFRRNEKGQTCTVSNMGRIELPEEMRPFFRRFEVALSATPAQPVKLGLVSYGDTLTCSFGSRIEETDIQRFFLRFLREKGVEFTIGCNEVTENEAMQQMPDEDRESSGEVSPVRREAGDAGQ